ncbi:unnamed protein product [Angiostrongylus costaricensis]|uniref:Innexin n=1 Tax=Angiostrongylus costaricensis TaxID=334426 RepID=A0A3P7H9B6_ANGCS|nr:unnamed protein product [Angiostrongylus costaricensis]
MRKAKSPKRQPSINNIKNNDNDNEDLYQPLVRIFLIIPLLGWVEYTRDYCLIENTYYVPMNDPNLPHITHREQQELPYYQWVQFVLVLLAFCFYLPHIYWRSINWWSGIQLRAIVKACCELPKENVMKREAAIEKIASHVYRTTQLKNFSPFCLVVKRGWLSNNYIIMKLMFIVNIALQIVILHIFLGFNWGDLFNLKLGFNTDWKSTGLFPRSTMCDFEVRNKGNLQRYSVQCVLSLNMFNEKIFLVLLYWLIFLFIKFDKFEESVDGDLIVILRLISSNAGANVCSDVTKSLFEKVSQICTESPPNDA